MTDRMTDEERALLHKAAEAYEDEQRKYQSYEQQLLERIRELESSAAKKDNTIIEQQKRISELEASDRGRVLYIRKLEGELIELQRKYDALVERLEHMAEMWDEKDRAAWRTDPSKHLNGFKCADELRALLEENDDE